MRSLLRVPVKEASGGGGGVLDQLETLHGGPFSPTAQLWTCFIFFFGAIAFFFSFVCSHTNPSHLIFEECLPSRDPVPPPNRRSASKCSRLSTPSIFCSLKMEKSARPFQPRPSRDARFTVALFHNDDDDDVGVL